MNAPQSALNHAAIRAEARDARRIAGPVAAALCLACAAVLLAMMALHLALALPDLAAEAVARRGM